MTVLVQDLPVRRPVLVARRGGASLDGWDEDLYLAERADYEFGDEMGDE